jgi:hypothetical protein
LLLVLLLLLLLVLLLLLLLLLLARLASAFEAQLASACEKPSCSCPAAPPPPVLRFLCSGLSSSESIETQRKVQIRSD